MFLLLAILLLCVPSLNQAAQIVDVGKLPPVAESYVAPGTIIELGYDQSRGVKARAQLETKPILEANDPLGGHSSHYLISVVFTDVATGKLLLEGQVAARTVTSNNQALKTIRLEAQPLKWSGLLTLPSKGETMIKIGSKLSDGKKRIYRFFYSHDPIAPLLEKISQPP